MAIVRTDGYPKARYDRMHVGYPQPYRTRTFDGYGLFAGLS
jgi:hypothetical protein